MYAITDTELRLYSRDWLLFGCIIMRCSMTAFAMCCFCCVSGSCDMPDT